LQALQKGGILQDLLNKLPQVERYTYNFQGNGQALDHVYVSAALQAMSEVDAMHVNSGLQDALQTSDHDPIFAIVRLSKYPVVELPLLFGPVFQSA
jgi:predicted extracellular nuclease